MESGEISFKEERVRKITKLYYSRPEIQKALFEFAKNREVCPRYFEGFGKRPDVFEYTGDIFELVKRGATSFHCSEEIWKDPLKIETGMVEKQLNEIREGWDLIFDIDSKYVDYSKIMAIEILKVLSFHGVKNVGIKFSGSKGFHLIIPWKAFPKEVNGIKTSDKFPEYPRILVKYIIEKTNNALVDAISKLSSPNKYIRDYQVSKEVMPDLVLVAPRHLFRMPYSLHEKTALASVVLTKEELENFQLTDASPMKLSSSNIRNFMPNCKEGEASELLLQALDWNREANPDKSIISSREVGFKPVKIDKISEEHFPPCLKNILKGISDGKKRSLFVLINLFRSVGMDKDEIEKRIYDWNKKNEVPLREGYIITQIAWAYRKKPIMPPNCKEFYQGIGVCQPDEFCKLIKNPVNYLIRKNYLANNKASEKKTKQSKKK
ncbi:MAG: DNA primase small subunit domain-containing protein [Nanobdellota archaeon]